MKTQRDLLILSSVSLIATVALFYKLIMTFDVVEKKEKEIENNITQMHYLSTKNEDMEALNIQYKLYIESKDNEIKELKAKLQEKIDQEGL